MKGFIIDATYKVINDKAHVLLFGRSEKGESFLTTHYTRPFFYIKEKDLKKAQKIGDFDSEKTLQTLHITFTYPLHSPIIFTHKMINKKVL